MSSADEVTVSDEQLDKFYEVILDLVAKGSETIRSAIGKEKKVDEKESSVDLVTETDRAVEKLIVEGIRYVVRP